MGKTLKKDQEREKFNSYLLNYPNSVPIPDNWSKKRKKKYRNKNYSQNKTQNMENIEQAITLLLQQQPERCLTFKQIPRNVSRRSSKPLPKSHGRYRAGKMVSS